MELKIDITELRKRKVFIATPMYGGMCSGQYTNSCVNLAMMAKEYDLDYRFFFIYNESLITRARNYLVDEFLRSDCTHLMFIDSDIGFDANDVIALAAIADPDSDKDIVCGPYPKKCIAWEKVKRAVDKGFADKDPNVLENFVGDYVFNPADGTSEIGIWDPVEVMEGGTGFMMIQRRVFEKFKEAYPQLSYKPDHVRMEFFDGSRSIHAFFDALIDDKTTNVQNEMKAFLEKNPTATHEDILKFLSSDNKTEGVLGKYSDRYLSEDYMFCQWSRRIGLKVWFCPWMKLSHMGSYVFSGSLVDLAKIGAAATADMTAIGKKNLA